MTIRIYPSRLPSEPLETHGHAATTLLKWLQSNVRGFRPDMNHPISIDVDGKAIQPSEWFDCHISPDSDVRIYPVPYAVGVVAWVAIALAVASVAYALFFAPSASGLNYSSVGSGDSLDLNPAKANSAKLGDPIREVFGRYRIYPDYVCQPVSRFKPDDPTVMVTEMFLCLGIGTFAFDDGDIRVGATPIGSLGDGFSHTKYAPGADVLGDHRSENWWNSTEVGGTSTGSGLDMAQTSPTSDDIVASSATVAGFDITFNGLSTTTDASTGVVTYDLPDSFVVGAIVEIVIPATVSVTNSGAYSRITSNALSEIVPAVGMAVTLTYNGVDYDLFIASYTPQSTGVTASVTLAYDSATGAAFTGIPVGDARLAISHAGSEYKINAVDGNTITVDRVIGGVIDGTWTGYSSRTVLDFSASGINDSNRWMGPFLACPENETTDAIEVNFSFPNGICGFGGSGDKQPRSVSWEIQYRIYGSEAGWSNKTGTYTAQNINGMGYTERINLSSPGLVEVRCRRTNEQGENNARDSMYWQALRSRLSGRPASYAGVTCMGVTVETGGKLAAQSDRRVNVVVTRNYEDGAARTISGALLHVGNSVGLGMDTDTIAELESTLWTPGGDFFDYSTDSASSNSSGSSSVSVLDMLNKITSAGKSYFLLSDGLASVGREGVKTWTGIISPQETTDHLQTAFSAPSDDDYNGVDVTYINGSTWAEETVQCRTPDNPTPLKIESYTLDGVLDKDHAYRIGMRRLMKYRQQRLTFTATTELDALCYNVGDRIIFTDDIPGNETVSCLVTSMSTAGGVTTVTTSEPLNWSYENPRALIRYQDGTASGLMVATRINEYALSVPHLPTFESIVMGDSAIEPPRLIFCDSARVGYDAIISDISPQTDGTCQVTASEYRATFYDYDSAAYPGNV
ncbi:host specificity factor TipJ family phage tail protein [Dickeya fangzhongdai]|uniref:host specificity factor TipJ family phage tail protein n=1 Tax=Dickeya fangzhongdai TaxID=1778540 RepID=UPI0004F824AE|nr:host specificity factor TipJ family phage tail protein [Dickeya fangzhongdai]AIR71486.1 kinase [Dickeya fangzhongdai]KGT98514.1 kinase [Dickeya fangzhongdai]